MNVNLLAVVTPLSVYHSWSARNKIWQENFTTLNMKNCDRYNVRKHKEIKNGEKYITLDISLGFGSLDKMKITSS